MNRILLLLILTVLCTGCAHKELKAPCKNVASLTAGDVPCDQRQPVNALAVPSVFAER